MCKIILSRKGFDSTTGGFPSPILGDRLVSLPIPDERYVSGVRGDFEEKYRRTHRYKEFKPQMDLPGKIQSRLDDGGLCHLDPDIRPRMRRSCPKGWRPALGQCDSAEGHLRNNHVGVGDIFLFWGLFQHWKAGKPSGKPLHVIWGYMTVQEVYRDGQVMACPLKYHPHCQEHYTRKKKNAIYVGGEYGVFDFHEELVLTAENGAKGLTCWKPIDWIAQDGKPHLTYHGERSLKECPGYFKCASRGQEFISRNDDGVAGANPAALAWFRELLKFRAPG